MEENNEYKHLHDMCLLRKKSLIIIMIKSKLKTIFKNKFT